MENEKENLIRLIQSGDEANVKLAIQLNIGQGLMNWEELGLQLYKSKSHIVNLHTYYVWLNLLTIVARNLTWKTNRDFSPLEFKLLVGTCLFGFDRLVPDNLKHVIKKVPYLNTAKIKM